MDRLAGIDAKLDRAGQTLAHVDHEWGAWQATEPFSWESGFDSGKGIFLVFMVMREPPPTTFALLASEFVHHVRSSLDHLACYLVEASGSQVTDRNAWPVLESDDQWTEKKIEGKGRFLEGASATAVAFVESKQPYKAGGDLREHPLLMLHKLWNLDKHQILSATPLTLKPPDPRTLFHMPHVVKSARVGWLIDSDSALAQRTAVAAFQFPVGMPLPRIVMDGQLPAQIGIGDGTGNEVHLEATLRAVRAIVAEARTLRSLEVPRS